MEKRNKLLKLGACSAAALALIPAGVLVAQAVSSSEVSNEVTTTVVVQDRVAPANSLQANQVDAAAYAANNLSAIDRMGGLGTLAGLVILGGVGLAGGVSLTRSFITE